MKGKKKKIYKNIGPYVGGGFEFQKRKIEEFLLGQVMEFIRRTLFQVNVLSVYRKKKIIIKK